MASKNVSCETCGNNCKITIKESEYAGLTDLVYCPFCGADISSEEEEITEDED